MHKTLFQKIADKEIPAAIVYEDELCVAFRDIAPAAPVHVLLVPRKPIPDIAAANAEDAALLAHLMLKVGDIARAAKLSETAVYLRLSRMKKSLAKFLKKRGMNYEES